MRISDWSSDVCSSDLLVLGVDLPLRGGDRAEEQPLHLPHLRLVVVERQRAGDADAVVGEVRLEALRPGIAARAGRGRRLAGSGLPRSEEHTSELQSLMRISYAVFCLKKKKRNLTQ